MEIIKNKIKTADKHKKKTIKNQVHEIMRKEEIIKNKIETADNDKKTIEKQVHEIMKKEEIIKNKIETADNDKITIKKQAYEIGELNKVAKQNEEDINSKTIQLDKIHSEFQKIKQQLFNHQLRMNQETNSFELEIEQLKEENCIKQSIIQKYKSSFENLKRQHLNAFMMFFVFGILILCWIFNVTYMAFF